MRFLVYLLAPVAIAVAGLLACHAVAAQQLPDASAALTLLGYAYLALGMQSLLFALAMTWLERRCRLRVRCLLAAVLGALCGGSLMLLDWILTETAPDRLLLPILGAVSGLLTTLLADRFPGRAAR